MNEKRYFVLVFGDPRPDKDRVESGTYQAGEGYPPFDVKPGDVLLLYCTAGYAEYPMQIPGIGEALESTATKIKYEWKPLAQPISREAILEEFDPADKRKMHELGIMARRAFTISEQSFSALMRRNISQVANVRFAGNFN